jgi:tetratricopeptide (TPR) repeat protein
VPENTKQKASAPSSVEVTRVSRDGELQSAKILFQEGLLDEAKKKLYQILIAFPNYPSAVELLARIRDGEMKGLLRQTVPTAHGKKLKTEDPERIIEKLNSDLGLDLQMEGFDPARENWVSQTDLSSRGHYDLGVAFFEMGCYRDAVRELKFSERKIRMEQTFLGELGVAVVALYSESLVKLDRGFEAKSYLEPILAEPDLNQEEKNVLFYVMGIAEASLGKIPEAKGWLQKVYDLNPDFRDVRFRLTRNS